MTDVKDFPASVLLAGIVCLYFPAIIYHANSEFIDSPFGYITFMLLPIFACFAMILFLPGLVLKGKLKTVYGGAIAVLALLAWITGNFLSFDRGLLDGKQPLRVDSSFYQRWELIGLLIAFLTLVIIAPKIYKILTNIVWIFVLMMIGMVLLTLLTDKKSYAIPKNDDSFYRVSSKKNVFIFLFDSFQSDLFQQILEQEPVLEHQLDGFTYFSKAAGVAPTTYLSLPAIHSGIEYSEGEALNDYYQQGVREGSFLSKLAAAGYDTSGVNFIIASPTSVTSLSSKQMVYGFWGSITRDALFLLDISLYRCAPSFFKQSVYNQGKWFTLDLFFEHSRAQEQNRFLRSIASKFSPYNKKPSARWIHLFNTHPPAEVDSNCRPIEKTRWNEEAARSQDTCVVAIFADLLEQFRKKNIYDNSLIVVLADHGQPFSVGMRPLVLGSAHPLLLIKPINAHGKLQISSNNVYLTDIPKTICELTHDCSSEKGTSAFDSDKLDGRSITFYEYQWKHTYWGNKFVPIKNRYSIVGPVDDVLSWFKRVPPEKINTLHLDFSYSDQPEVYGFGWGGDEKGKNEDYRWALGPYAQLYLPLKLNREAKLNVIVSTHRRNKRQFVTLYVDKNLVARLPIPVGPKQTLSFRIPAKLISNPVSRLTFRFDQYTELRKDPRAFAVSFYQLDVVYDYPH